MNDSPQDHQRQPQDLGSTQQPHCPVRPVRNGASGYMSYLVTGYAEARQALADPRLSKNTAAFFANNGSKRRLHPAISQSMLASDPPQHTRLRKLVAKAFTTGSVAALRPFIEQVTDDLLDAWPTHGQADVVAELAMPLPVTVICELLGVPEDNRSDIKRWSAELFAAGRPERIDAASHAMAEYMTGLIAERRERPGDALLDDLIRVRDGEDRLSEEELVSLAVLLLVAGHETTTNFIGSALLALFQQPTDLERLRREPDLIPGVLDELLRHSSPVSVATFRYTTEAITLGGTEIPADTPVQVAIGAANRDPARFPAPAQLDLGRDTTGHLSFGHGIHRCVGAPLARAEAELALRKLLIRFPDLRLAVPPGELVWRPTRLVRGLATLPVLV
ncbi:cytochrome P450 107B1 (P450CVIIB1) [Streptomyces himastatinicus ATCC 53653]|uniref:Cytochrome P450 107B1 (P450CVIIB1) n=1 Tax=Streptomyces himastatinicus ATCC 53653 TaxID=457427 RepID=D9WHB9_9ACTN|nr:cytochrome P450 [Streptomyces himastatinicus]EFL29045.1 cytochrome P450 107B1 (P450CVIIB1) [Streptomyces himastatinicus ATCC 53653]